MSELQAVFWPDWVPAVVTITDWGGPLGWVFALQLVFYLQGVRQGVFIGLVAVLTLLLNSWLKALLFQPRPYMLDPSIQVHQAISGLGMPSGHAQGAAAVWCGAVAALRPAWVWQGLALVLVLAVCASRVILGVHSLSQVMVGAALGFAGLWLALRLRARCARWLAAQSNVKGATLVFLAVTLALAFTLALGWLQSAQPVPTEWQANFAAVNERLGSPAALSLDSLLAPSAAYALITSALGLTLVAWLQRRYPMKLVTAASRGLCLLMGIVVTALVWWLAARLAWLESPAALLLALLYPVLCGYLPVAITAALLPAAAHRARPLTRT